MVTRTKFRISWTFTCTADRMFNMLVGEAESSTKNELKKKQLDILLLSNRLHDFCILRYSSGIFWIYGDLLLSYDTNCSFKLVLNLIKDVLQYLFISTRKVRVTVTQQYTDSNSTVTVKPQFDGQKKSNILLPRQNYLVINKSLRGQLWSRPDKKNIRFPPFQKMSYFPF